MADKTTADCWQVEETRRQIRLDAARRCSSITIPSLFPAMGFTGDQDELPLPYDSTVARGISNLSAKITDAVFPANGVPWFEASPNKLKVPQGTSTADAETTLNLRVRDPVIKRLLGTNLRRSFTESNEKMLVGGNDLIWFHDDWTFSNHSFEDYVKRCKPNGEVEWFILREWVDGDELPDGWKNVPARQSQTYAQDVECCYTKVWWDKASKKWMVTKEFRGVIVDRGAYLYEPFVFNEWRRVPKSHYARSYIEDIEGDVMFAESIAKAVKEGSLLISKALIGIDPSGITEIADIMGCENGEPVPARKDDVFPITAGSQIQLASAMQARQDIRRDLGRAFLMASAIQQNKDRQTAAEWQIMAQELFGVLGPNFASKASDIQLKIIRRAMALMAKESPEIKEVLDQSNGDGFVDLTIRTGLESLAKEVENAQLSQFAMEVSQIPPLQSEVKWDGYLRRKIAANGWDPTDLVKTPQEKAAEMQQQLQMMAAQQGIQSLGSAAEAGAKAAVSKK